MDGVAREQIAQLSGDTESAHDRLKPNRRSLIRKSVLISVVVPLLLALWSGSSAHATVPPAPWVPLASPCGTGQQPEVLGATHRGWFVRCGNQIRRSSDAGQNWADIPPLPSGYFVEGEPAVSPAGLLYLVGRSNTGPTLLYAVDPTSGSLSGVTFDRGWLETATRGVQFVWDGQGRMWRGWCDGSWSPPSPYVQVAEIHLAQVAADGSLSGEVVAPVAPAYSCTFSLGVDLQGSVFVRYFDEARPVAPASVLRPNGSTLVTREAPVLYDTGGLKVTTEGFSFDGGPLNPEPPSSWGGEYFVFPRQLFGDATFAEWKPGMLVQGLPMIQGAAVQMTPAGLFASAPDLLAHYQGPPYQPAGDAVPPVAQRMVDEANAIRGSVGLPPLYASALITQAAQNHSRYWTLNDSSGQGLGLHDETPGRPGFTGASPTTRCAAVGTVCSGEVMGADVEGWITTAFHRSFLMSPAPAAVGGTMGESGGPSVMNADETAPGFLGRPFGYPVGDYKGALSFDGELPDPGQELCPGKISPPYGVAITVETPGTYRAHPRGVGGIRTLSVVGPSGPVAGCSKNGVFVPDDPLTRGSEYTATVEWSDPAQPAFSWTFRTAGGNPNAAPPGAKKRSTPIVRPANGKSRIKIIVKPDLGPKTQWPFRVLQRGKHKTWKPVSKKTLWTRGAKHTRAFNLAKGAYRVRTVASHGYRGSTSKTVLLRK